MIDWRCVEGAWILLGTATVIGIVSAISMIGATIEHFVN